MLLILYLDRQVAGKSLLFVAFTTEFVKVISEYLVYDLGAIVAAIGGALGLFLGFSCLGVIYQMLSKLEERTLTTVK